MSFNFRVMAVPDTIKKWDAKYVTLFINDVFNDEDGMPNGYGVIDSSRWGASVSGDTIDELRYVLGQMRVALEKPILCAGDRWPEEYKPTEHAT